MSEIWRSVLTELIPLALVVALSPLTIIPAVLVLHTPRPKPTGLAFMTGWLVGLAALTALFVAVSNLLGGLDHKPPSWASWLRIVIGAALVGTFLGVLLAYGVVGPLASRLKQVIEQDVIDSVIAFFALFVLTVAAAEAAIGLAILVVFFRNRGSIDVEDINMMKG